VARSGSLNESIVQLVPGAGILIGGAVTALGSPRVALAVAAAGSLAVTAAAWVVLGPLGSRRLAPAGAGRDTDPGREPAGAVRAGDARPEDSLTPAVRHQ
jgi:hypothetical protein